ncbi:radical SAM protein [Vagococcus fluvialis]|uniref:Arylsulfatase regulator (Fe-S oxidoreductase) n=1 Tax=Vagococcus fluvialis bH819 TaxID=1255619 RepID=A0A1X6WRS7_9ENTE|nr:radical SAM protein [Vagococcus fluvialis]SLM86977.1 Arylsulfatase regulator (Fe-S oxidoreductase) [Vagococcus fluvialis bH819]
MYLTLESPNSPYLYDTNTNKIIQISENICTKINNKDFSNSSEISILLKEGLLKENTVKKIIHPETRNLEHHLNSGMNQLILQITQECNLRCSYCPYSCDLNSQRSHTNKRMSWDVAKKSIDFFYSHSKSTDEVVISFYGGEPILNFKLMEKCVEYAKFVFLGKNINFNITSNGTIWNKKIMAFLVENDFSITLSLDGPKKIHDKHRTFKNGKGSFDLIMKYLSDAISEHGKTLINKLSINMVMDPSNDFDEINNLFKNKLLKDINLRAEVIDDDFSEEKNIYSDDFIEKIRYHEFLSIINYFHLVKIQDTSKITEYTPLLIETDYERFLLNYDKLDENFSPSGPCIPGQRRLFVDVNGEFFPCERISENNDFMNIGNLSEGMNMCKSSRILNIATLTENECKNCWAFRLCNHCVKLCDDNGVISREKKLAQCYDTKNGAYSIIKNAIFISELNNLYLKERKHEENNPLSLW